MITSLEEKRLQKSLEDKQLKKLNKFSSNESFSCFCKRKLNELVSYLDKETIPFMICFSLILICMPS